MSASPSSTVHLSLIRGYTPDPDLDWLRLSYDQQGAYGWSAFVDPVVEGEFCRFANRDYIGVVTSLGFAVAFVAWPILFPGQFTAPYQAVTFLAGALALTGAIVSAFLALHGPLTAFKAVWRARLAIFMAMVCCVGLSVCDVAEFYPRCVKAENILAPILSPADLNATHYLRDCNRVVAAYPVVALSINLALVSITPASAAALGIFNFAVLYAGYGATSTTIWTTGETTKELILKLVIYLFTYVAAVLMVVLRHSHTRQQFVSAARAHVQSLVTRQRSEEVDAMLGAMVPESALDKLICNEPVTDFAPDATVLFSDMVSFTAWSSARETSVVVAMLNTLCIEFDRCAKEMGVEKVKTIGDAYWAVTGLPTPVANHAAAMVYFALEMHRIVKRTTSGRTEWGSVRLRVGVNSGPLRGGIFGTSRLSYEVFGETSDMAEECEKNGAPERVCVSEATKLRLDDAFTLESHTKVDDHDTYLVRSRAGGGTAVLSPLHNSSFDSPSHFSGDTGSPLSRPVKSIQDQLQQRRNFIAKRAAKQAENVEDAEQVEARIAKRRWSWVFLNFDDDAVEAQYHSFIAQQNGPMQRAARMLMVVFIALQLIVAGADQPETVGVAPWVLIPIALATAVFVTAMLFVVEGRPAWLDVGFFAVVLVDAVGCGLGDDSLVSNDITYIFSVALALLVNGANALSWPVKAALLALCGVAPTIAFSYTSLLFNSVLGFMAFGLFIAGLADVTIEVMYRRQFVESAVQEYSHGAQLAREAEQRALLEAIVPAHVIPRLQAWLSTGMDVNGTIAQVYERVAVGFLSLHHEAATEEWLFDAHIRVDDAIAQHCDGHFDKIKTIGDKVMIAGSFRSNQLAGAACSAMLRTVGALRTGANRAVMDVTSGFHVGEVMGAVLGTERLCFDIFGDTVNVASRVLSTLEAGEYCGISEAFYEEAFESSAAAPITGCTASCGLTRAAKGKGTIVVHSVQFQDQLFLPETLLRERNPSMSSFRRQRHSSASADQSLPHTVHPLH